VTSLHLRKTKQTYKVHDLTGKYQSVESVHHFLDAGRVVPPVNIEQIDVGRPELLQGTLDSEMHGLDVITAIQNLLLDSVVAKLSVVRVLG
jgi:hypothetical protein